MFSQDEIFANRVNCTLTLLPIEFYLFRGFSGRMITFSLPNGRNFQETLFRASPLDKHTNCMA